MITNIAIYPGASWFDGDGGNKISSVCTFDRVKPIGATYSLVLLDLPIFVMIVANFVYYKRGVDALANSPDSVVSRRLYIALGYLFVQLLVFVPNLLYNILSINEQCNECHFSLFYVTIVVNVLQGFLNVLVYVYNDSKISHWFVQILCKSCGYNKEKSSSDLNSGKNDNTAAAVNSAASNNDVNPNAAVTPIRGGHPTQTPHEREDDDDEDDAADELVLIDILSSWWTAKKSNLRKPLIMGASYRSGHSMSTDKSVQSVDLDR